MGEIGYGAANSNVNMKNSVVRGESITSKCTGARPMKQG